MIPTTIPFNPRRILYTAIVSGAVLVVTGLMLFIVQARPITAQALSVVGGKKAATTPGDHAPMQEVHIANNGMMLLRGATVVSVTADIIRVTMEFGPSNFTWQIQNNSGTIFTSSKGETEKRVDVKVGDIVTVTGKLLLGGNEPMIHAEYLRE